MIMDLKEMKKWELVCRALSIMSIFGFGIYLLAYKSGTTQTLAMPILFGVSTVLLAIKMVYWGLAIRIEKMLEAKE